ncbi:hypothetical protein ACFLV0_05135 [Chloroflexota bacterium]
MTQRDPYYLSPFMLISGILLVSLAILTSCTGPSPVILDAEGTLQEGNDLLKTQLQFRQSPLQQLASVPYAFEVESALYTDTAGNADILNGLDSIDLIKVKQLIHNFVVAAGEKITAGDVVSFLDGYVQKGVILCDIITYGSEYVFNLGSTWRTSAAALSSGKFVVVYRDDGNNYYGTAVIGVVSGTTITYGSEYVFNPAITDHISVAALSSGKFVVAYQDASNSNYGTAVIGDVSGTTITYGSEYVFNLASTLYPSTTALYSDKFAVAYRDNGNSGYGTAIIGDVSGTTITYGSEYVFNLGSTVFPSTDTLSSDKFVVAYQDDGNSKYGTAVIGDVSGTTITYGSEYVFNLGDTWSTSAATLSSGKFVVAYTDISNLEYGTAVIGDISGTTITYGSEYEFNLGSTMYPSAAALSSDKFVVVYRDDGNNYYGTAAIGDISGTTITYGSEYVFNKARTEYISAAALYSDKFVMAYRDDGNSKYGTAVIGDVSVEPCPGITVNPTSGLSTTEVGGTANFTIVLDSEPTASVSIGMSSDDTDEGIISPASVTFTTANWDTPQQVTVTGVDDDIDDGNIAYSIITAAASSGDSKYNGMNASDIGVTNNNDDIAGITVNPTSGLSTTEGGGTANFTIVLDSEPTASVSIGMSSDNTDEGIVSPATVTFTTANWDTPQEVTVTGIDDDIVDGDIAYTIVTNQATSGDSNYSIMDPTDISVTNNDLGVFCLDPEVTITNQGTTDDPASDPDTYNPTNMPPDVIWEDAKAFYLEATGPDDIHEFFITFSDEGAPLEVGFTLFKLPDWTEIDYTIVGPRTIRVVLEITDGVVDPPFVLAQQKADPPPSPTPPPTMSVGGEAYPVNKVGLIAPWMALAMVVAAGSIYLVRRRALGSNFESLPFVQLVGRISHRKGKCHYCEPTAIVSGIHRERH